ncbi:rRNA maturation RNase YbeY [Anaplasma phagocytophilum]|uniref:rRNA maturation RNase YbeY n=1 Tax=Anaplasma phagocytophilum TaxID=948 RepID=UPI00200ECBBA|nr:rRNA maturation RNase YbeY [Anaplasma phagocytophilum]UQD54328.1 rRNA maturation RNase YbeY [Anaplasma phagocytophilum]
MPVEVSTIDRKWYRTIRKPKATSREIVSFTLRELKVDEYNPIVSVVLAHDALLLELNHKYRNINKPTNVLSFNYEALSRNCCLGEIFLSIDRLTYESKTLGVEIHAHFTHMLIHGVLHILGYDHEVPEDAQEMQALEIDLLSKRSIENPYLIQE